MCTMFVMELPMTSKTSVLDSGCLQKSTMNRRIQIRSIWTKEIVFVRRSKNEPKKILLHYVLPTIQRIRINVLVWTCFCMQDGTLSKIKKGVSCKQKLLRWLLKNYTLPKVRKKN